MASDTKTFYSQAWNFSLTYPAEWEVIYQDEPAGSWTIPIAVAGADVGSGRPCFMINARHGEILQGSSHMPVFAVGPDGQPIKMPSTPAEYIEMNKQTLRQDFPGFQFISAEEIRLAYKPAARLVYSYSGQRGRITEESTTLFGVGVTFQFIGEVPSTRYAEFQPCLRHILESFRIGREMPEEAVVESPPQEPIAELSPTQLYNRGASLYRHGDFEAALAAFEGCFRSGEYQLQAVYALALCQQQLGREIALPEELGDRADAAGPVYVATSLATYLMDQGHQAAMTKQGKTSDVQAYVGGAHYRISIISGFGFGGFFKNAWRKEGEKYIPLADRSVNPNPTDADRFVIALVERAHLLPPLPLPEGGLPMSLEPLELEEVPELAEVALPAEDRGSPIASEDAIEMQEPVSDAPAVAEPPAYPAAPVHAVTERTSPLAVVSLAAGIATWLLLPLIGAIVAIITGHLARREIGSSSGSVGGKKLANIGLALGYGQLALAVLIPALILLSAPSRRPEATVARQTVVLSTKQLVVIVTPAAQQTTALGQTERATATALVRQDTVTAQAVQATTTAQAQQAAATAQAVQATATARAAQVVTPTPLPAATLPPTVSEQGPEEVMTAYHEALRQRDFQKVASFFSDFSLTAFGTNRETVRLEFEKRDFNGWRLVDYQVKTTHLLGGQTALVRMFTKQQNSEGEQLQTLDFYAALRYEDGQWRPNLNNLLYHTQLDVPPQTVNGVTVQPTWLARYADKVQLFLNIENTNDRSIVWGDVQEKTGTFHFPDQDQDISFTQGFAIVAQRTLPNTNVYVQGFFEAYPTSVDLLNWRWASQGSPELPDKESEPWSYTFALKQSVP